MFEIQVPEIAKPAGIPCQHLKGGCAIYDTRPDVCRHWLCGWRLIPGLPENWRPDLSGILIYQITSAEPGYGSAAFILGLARGVAHLEDVGVLGFIQNMVLQRVPLFLNLRVGKGEALSTFLNRPLEPFVAANDGKGFIAMLADIIQEKQLKG